MAVKKIDAVDMSKAVKQGFDRLNLYRKSRASFLKAYVGQYYNINRFSSSDLMDQTSGDTPLGLIYTAIRSTVPHLVMRNPKMDVYTDYPQLKDIADTARNKLNSVVEQINLYKKLRAWIVDAFFAFGIAKVGLKMTGQVLTIDDMDIDPGQVFVENVDLDDFVFDPLSTEYLFTDAMFLGNRVRVPRQMLLDTKGYDHDEVAKLPVSPTRDGAKNITGADKFGFEFGKARDLVDVIELWLPHSNKIVTMGDPCQTGVGGYIRETEFNGPDSGPYVFLSFSQPVPGNPLPLAPVSFWFDLHYAANAVFGKSVDQMLRQKDVGLYDPSNADIAQDIKEASDGDMLASSDPNAVNVVSFGGSNQNNDRATATLQTWFNYMAGNPEQLAGLQSSSKTATQAQIMQSNSAITIEDAKDIIYSQTADIIKNVAWYIADDPLDPTMDKEDWIEFSFKIVPKSMGRVNPQIRVQRAIELATNVIPAAAQAAMVCMQMGTPFDFAKFIIGVAKELDLEDWVTDVFNDPAFMQKMAYMMMLGPAKPNKEDNATPGALSLPGVIQNKGNPMQKTIAGPQQMFNQGAQATAAQAQSMNRGV